MFNFARYQPVLKFETRCIIISEVEIFILMIESTAKVLDWISPFPVFCVQLDFFGHCPVLVALEVLTTNYFLVFGNLKQL